MNNAIFLFNETKREASLSFSMSRMAKVMEAAVLNFCTNFLNVVFEGVLKKRKQLLAGMNRKILFSSPLISILLTKISLAGKCLCVREAHKDPINIIWKHSETLRHAHEVENKVGSYRSCEQL